MKKLFCTDLDSTIICSEVPSEFGICVAVKNGYKASFMKNDAYNTFLEIIKKIDVVPVTTRCAKSYSNIYLKKFFKYALVENGSILLCNDINESNNWIKESRNIIKEDKKYFDEVRKIIEKYNYKEKWGSEFVLDYINESITIDKINEMKKELSSYDKNLLFNFGKTSFICTYLKLSKGNNIKRFADKYNYELFISAGDNLEDESMFKYTKYSIGKNNATFNLSFDSKLDFCEAIINKANSLI